MHPVIISILLSLPAQATAAPETQPADSGPAAAAHVSGLPSIPGSNDGAGGTQFVKLLGPTFTNTPWTGWLVLLLGIFAGLAAGKIIQTIMKDLARRMERRKWEVRSSLFQFAAGPASLAAITAGIYLGLQGLELERDAQPTIARFIGLLYIVAIGWFLFNMVDLVDLALRRVAARHTTKLDDTLMPLIRKALRVFLLIVMALFVAKNTFGWDITAWLAGLGIAGLAVSLAAQDSVKNLFGSMTVLIERPFSVGDRVIVMGYDGVVENIGFRSTRIRTVAGHRVTIPNMRFTDNTIENITVRPSMNRVFNLTLRPDTTPDQVTEAVRIIRNILASPDLATGFDMTNQPPRVYFNALNTDSLNINVTYWYLINAAGHDQWTYQDHAQEVNLRIVRELGAAGIRLAVPMQTLRLENDADSSAPLSKGRTPKTTI